MALEQSFLHKKSKTILTEEVKEIVVKAIELYNRFRSPEARAKLLSIEGNKAKVLFEGSFCLTCGIRDWVEDLVYVFEQMGVEAELIAYIEPENMSEFYRIGVFIIKGYIEGKEDNRGVEGEI